MAFFYRFVAAAMDLENLESPAVGMMTPYSALFVFAIGIFISNFLFNSLLMRKPFTGVPVAYSQYFKGNMNTHVWLVFLGVPFGRWEQRAVILLPEQPVLPFPMGWDKGLRWLPHYGGCLFGRNSKGLLNLLIY